MLLLERLCSAQQTELCVAALGNALLRCLRPVPSLCGGWMLWCEASGVVWFESFLQGSISPFKRKEKERKKKMTNTNWNPCFLVSLSFNYFLFIKERKNTKLGVLESIWEELGNGKEYGEIYCMNFSNIDNNNKFKFKEQVLHSHWSTY